MQYSSPKQARIALSALLVVALSALALWNHLFLMRFHRIEANSAEAVGSVTGLECSNHGKIHYRFTAHGRNWNNSGFCPMECAPARIGDPVTVVFEARDPHNSVCTSAATELDRWSGNYFALFVAGALLFIGILRATDPDEVSEYGR
ncbi:DUF3592 domain-containing protein [Cognatilysobacter lacus]|uniref:DUF3592 domain-containing protein n=1 Tax=Cognatilysobacter lacus TaxID=1643323 RepID=A0A5D8Z7F6_9GAMM|nr:DUF3592 domain-containing protein [Lysobacter lacus]TZF90721.1 DUF3592 domain-containing protein [Lysobacter lacus]